jgi:type II secretory pathway pseudopilin PulG
MRRVMKGSAHLSYIELVIIAAVLGVVAVKVGPQLTQATEEEKVSELVDGLEIMRANLDLYQAEHEGCLPPCNSFESFETAITTKVGRFGPYIKRMPRNPFNKLDTVRFDGEPAGVGIAGWRLDTKTGLFQADNQADYAAL